MDRTRDTPIHYAYPYQNYLLLYTCIIIVLYKNGDEDYETSIMLDFIAFDTRITFDSTKQ
jgi:hypothetical protein